MTAARCEAETTDHEGTVHRCWYEPGHDEPMHMAIHRVAGVALRLQWRGPPRVIANQVQQADDVG